MLRLKLRTLIHYLLNDEEKRKKSKEKIRQIKAVDCRSREIEKSPNKKNRRKQKILTVNFFGRLEKIKKTS